MTRVYFSRRGVDRHSDTSDPNYSVSAGCFRMTRFGARIINYYTMVGTEMEFCVNLFFDINTSYLDNTYYLNAERK